MNRGAGAVVAILILVSVIAGGGSRSTAHVQGEDNTRASRLSRASTKSGGANALTASKEGQDENKRWSPPPDPRCFLVRTIREFYGSDDPSQRVTAGKVTDGRADEAHVPAGPFYEAYRLDKYGCPLATLDEAHLEAEERTYRTWGVPSGSKPPIRFMIATVPDPVRSHLSLFFDRSMDAIQEAAQAAGYLFSRAGMPWETEPGSESSDIDVKLALDYYQRSREKLPGLMIFRKLLRPNSVEDLFVFVVGETPTGGIHKEQFKNAVSIANDIRMVPGFEPAGPGLSVMGPTFSGSLPSLKDLLASDGQVCNLLASGCVVDVHSGTVTSYIWSTWFERVSHKARFITFQESDSYEECHFFSYALKQKYKLSEIAELSEDETAFGNGGGDESEPAFKECELREPDDIVRVRFPREISQLRTAYQNALQETSDIEAGKEFPRTTLPLNLQDSGSDEDTVPTYAHQQYPLSQEAIMLTIATVLRAHHSRFILVKATDPMDLLFLTRFLRRAYPQGRVVTLESDLLYRREVEDDLLHGIMAITPYSLLPRADDWVAKPSCLANEPHLDPVFPSSYSAGTYNAMLSLLPPEGACGSSGTGLSGQNSTGRTMVAPQPYTEFGWPTVAGDKRDNECLLHPTLWLTVLGRDSYWPIASLEMYNSGGPKSNMPVVTGGYIHSPPGSSDRLAPRSWILLTAGAVLFALFCLAAIHNGSLFSASETYAMFAPGGRNRQMVVAIAAVLVLWTFGLLWVPWIWENGVIKDYADYVLAALGIIVSGCLGACFFLEIWRRRELAGNRFGVPGQALVVMFGGLTWLAIFGWSWPAQEQSSANMAVIRYTHATSGVSSLPACLFLLAAGLWWSWHNLEGVALNESRGAKLPSENDLSGGRWRQFRLTDENAQKLDRLLQVFPRAAKIYYPGIIVCILTLLAWLDTPDHFHPIWSLELWPFDLLYIFILLIVAVLLSIELMKLISAWLEFRRILHALDGLLLRRSFCYLGGFSWKRLWSLGGGTAHDANRAFNRELTAWRYLVETERGSELSEELGHHARRIENIVAGFHETVEAALHDPKYGRRPQTNRLVLSQVAAMRSALAKACASVLNSLEVTWKDEKGPKLYDSDDPKSVASVGEISAETRVREQFVALAYVNFIVTTLLRMRAIIVSIAGIYVFGLLSLSTYPFEPKVVLRPLLILTFFAILGVIGWVYAQMHREPTLSRLTDTTPGELGGDFYLRMGGFLILPLVSLLVSQFPDVNNFVFSWLQPAVQALNH
jgi:hypothetical protein